MKYLLDTDIASYYLRGKFNLQEIFQKKGPEDIRLSRVTLAEMEVLAYKGPNPTINSLTIAELARWMGVLEVDVKTWQIFSRTKAELLSQGKPKGDLDILQAAVAKQHGLVVITHNTGHFQDLVDFEDWIPSRP